ncbi:hypothetical protein NE237_013634 [Protea cynaroides]|uniref:Uncharacterized protein n=1 Tax=Protea cynaroides TaxID=273540 RepID=A0A9Q0JYR2_9MAGN|nr:hypothetical protein NE237_013634 [Protea cynaroides]
MKEGDTTDIYVLSEGCIADILSLTTPRDACRSSVVSLMFRSAADSDSVWERFLPSDIQLILSSSMFPSLPNFSSKKEQFLHLCDNPLLIDNGTKTFALEKCSGKKCYMIGAKQLAISWGDTPLYWNWPSLPESRFSEVAELLRVCWLEIRGRMKTRLLSPNTTYVAYLVFKLTDNAYGFGNAHPVEVSVKLVGGDRAEQGEVKLVYLNKPEETEADSRPEGVPKERKDGWMEIKMGEFFNERDEDRMVEMSLMEVDDYNWKSGLIIQGIELRPKWNH